MPDKQYSSNSYRYGFNGKESDNEVKGTGCQYDYGFRIYDPRIARFLSVDPLTKEYPWYAPYQFAGNKPIWAVDLDGLEEEYYQDLLINNFGYNNLVIPVVNQTQIHKEFIAALKNQKIFDVYYRTADISYDKTNTYYDFESFRKAVGDKEAEQFRTNFENGKVLIVITMGSMNMDPLIEAAFPEGCRGVKCFQEKEYNDLKLTIAEFADSHVHEEFHALREIIGVSNLYADHEALFGDYSYDTPDQYKILTDEKYKNTKQYQLTDEIGKAVDKLLPRGNNTNAEIVKRGNEKR